MSTSKRSKWKGPFIDLNLLKNLTKSSQDFQKRIEIFERSSTIIPALIGMEVFVHNGKSFKAIQISPEMVGHKFGEFARTKATWSYKKKKKVNKLNY